MNIIEYQYRAGTKMYVICEMPVFGIITSEMYVNEIKPTFIKENEFNIEYNLVGLFVNININEKAIDTKQFILHEDNKLWVFSDKLVYEQFLKDNFS